MSLSFGWTARNSIALMRKTKIVCTLGPATDSQDEIRALVKAGMNVARINASHGTHAEHEARIRRVRTAAVELHEPVAVLVDLQGPKIRVGEFADGPVGLAKGDVFTITTRDVPGTREVVSTSYRGFAGDCKVGDVILIDDGKVQLRVLETTDADVRCECLVPGTISDHKGVNLPGAAVSLPALTEKDEEDLRWALGFDADYIALSFVRSAKDIEDIRRIMDEMGVRLPVIAKIEKPQAVEHMEEIVEAFDGIMVARGDLGVELPFEEVPMVQKRIIMAARHAAKPVIVATQVLDSMIENPRPTRAEASDCANAILDGASAVMLSGETSVGEYPIECVETIAHIAEQAEEQGADLIPDLGTEQCNRYRALARGALCIAADMKASALVVFSTRGRSVRRVARMRSMIPLFAFTDSPQVYRQLALVWGARPYLVASARHTSEKLALIDSLVLERGLLAEGEDVVMIAPAAPSYTTNTIRIHRIGNRSAA